MAEPSEFEFKIRRVTEVCGTIRACAGYSGITLCAYMAITAFRDVALAHPDQVRYFGGIIESIKIQHWLPSIITVLTGGAWLYERKGKKRAIREKSRLQKQLEEMDPSRTSSGLTECGDTPRG